MPWGQHSITAELHVRSRSRRAARFAIREGGRTVGAGTISEISNKALISARAIDADLKQSKEQQKTSSPACTECKRRNYSTTKKKEEDERAARITKVCRFCASTRS
jgi:ribosomal protein L33